MTTHVFLFEGFGGYPFGFVRRFLFPSQRRRAADFVSDFVPESWQQLLFGIGSPAQAANFVLPLFANRAEVKTYYLPQTHHWYATRAILSIRAREPEARIALIGFSYGGNAAHRVAHQVCRAVDQDNIDNILSLVLTIDPVGKWRINTTPAQVGDYGFSRPPRGVTRWINCYQRCDCGSFRIARGTPLEKKIWGDCVADADENRFLTAEDFRRETICNGRFAIRNEESLAYYAHLWCPAHKFVQEKIAKFLEVSF